MNSRETAARILKEWAETGKFPDRMIPGNSPDHGFIMEVVYGVIRNQRALDWIIEQLADRPPHKTVRPFLLVGLYQLLMMDTVEGFAAVHETVEAIKNSPATSAAGFVNAVLRRTIRERDALLADLEVQPLAVRESHPDLLVEHWTAAFGPEDTADLCRWDNTRPDVVVRPNLGRVELESFVAALESKGIASTPHPFCPTEFLIMPHGLKVPDIPGFADGLFTVQDPSTLAAIQLLDPQPDDRVLDACAAPGGKTALIAERLGDKGQVLAMDIHDDRLALLKQNQKRLAWSNVQIVVGDASSPDGFKKALENGPFDRILLDVPCSNTGVLRRRPDARWRFSLHRLQKLVSTQRAILDAVGTALKPGGRLVFSTCSLEKEEGKDLITAWLEENAGFVLLESVELFPTKTQTDGVFAVALEKKGAGGS